MNFEMLDCLIPARRLPNDATAPRGQLFDMFRDLEALRRLRAEKPDDADLEQQIRFHERILET